MVALLVGKLGHRFFPISVIDVEKGNLVDSFSSITLIEYISQRANFSASTGTGWYTVMEIVKDVN